MRRVIKAKWDRRRPPTQGYMQTLNAEREYWKQDRIEHVMALVGSTERVSGVVGRIEKYGAFVKFNWGEGLIHISKISKNRVRHPNEVVSPGQKVWVYVLAVDDKSRISLSLIGHGKRKPPQTEQPIKATLVRNATNGQEPGSLDAQSTHHSAEMIEGKQPIRSFAELAAYWKSREGQ